MSWQYMCRPSGINLPDRLGELIFFNLIIKCLFSPADGTVLAGTANWWKFAYSHQMAAPASTVPSTGRNKQMTSIKHGSLDRNGFSF